VNDGVVENNMRYIDGYSAILKEHNFEKTVCHPAHMLPQSNSVLENSTH
jgi:hypothetical protein